MMNLGLTSINKIYFIGIGGIGMSATAGIAQELGFEVSGSDSKTVYDPAKSVLDNHHIPYHTGYDVSHVSGEPFDLFVASSGEDMSNPEIAYVRENDYQMVSFSELLRALSDDKLRLVVSGTHGKSTTAGLMGKTLELADDSSFMTGAVLQHGNTNFHNGEGHYFVFEGDEYKALFDDPTPKFQQYQPDILVLTNLEFDHPDVFASIEDLKEEFAALIGNMPPDGFIAYNSDNILLEQLMHESNVGHVSFGIHHPADFVAKNITIDEKGTTFDVEWNKAGHTPQIETYFTHLYGEMNVYNALAAIACLRPLGFDSGIIQQGLDSYYGVKRRFELIGEKNGVIIYDDYAHHPTAIRETLLAARSRYPTNRIWAIFEPHTFSRTEAVLPDLVKSFIPANKVIISEIYSAREKQTPSSITGRQVVEEIQKHHSDVRLVSGKDEALAMLKAEAQPGDVVIVMAVGIFNKLAPELLAQL